MSLKNFLNLDFKNLDFKYTSDRLTKKRMMSRRLDGYLDFVFTNQCQFRKNRMFLSKPKFMLMLYFYGYWTWL